jgi:hypothetical protein
VTTTLKTRAQFNAPPPTDACWTDVVGFEGLYAVARPDRVKALDRYVPQGSRWGHPVVKFHAGRELTPYTTENGRQRVVLHDAAHRRHAKYVDDLVRQAFGVEAA